jgi:SAM-dependent methyltransferase
MRESSKAMVRRLYDQRFATRYFVGEGIDIGAGNDSISLYRELFPSMGGVRAWDMPDGDAQYMEGIADESYDFVHSSHCLEHMVDPSVALKNWFRILKPGGYLICVIPDEDLYEQGTFPSSFNPDHKWTFTTWKPSSWSNYSINLFDLIPTLGGSAQTLRIELLDATYHYGLPRFDQTLTPMGESAIELIIRKRHPQELEEGGRLPPKDKGLTQKGFTLLTGISLK